MHVNLSVKFKNSDELNDLLKRFQKKSYELNQLATEIAEFRLDSEIIDR